MTPDEQTILFDEKLKGISANIENYNKLILVELKYIRAQTESTNDRVDKLERVTATKIDHYKYEKKVETLMAETAMIRWFERNPVRFALVIFLFLLLQIPSVRDLLFGWF